MADDRSRESRIVIARLTRKIFRGCILLAYVGSIPPARAAPPAQMHNAQPRPNVERVAEQVRGTSIELRLLPGTTGGGYGSLPLLSVMVGKGPPLNLLECAEAVDRLLRRLDQHNALPPRFAFQPADLRPEIVELVQRDLMHPAANWNRRTGNARSGAANRTLAIPVLAAVQGTPLGAAFGRNGYRLESIGRVDRVEVGRVPIHGTAVLPTEIADMGLVAVRVRQRN